MPKAPSIHAGQFAFRTTLTFRNDAAWPARIWEALAAAGGAKGAAESGSGDTGHHPKKLNGTFEVGANVLATKAPAGWNPQLVKLSFAAFDPKSGAPVGWSRDHSGESADPGWFGGTNAQQKGVKIRDAFLTKLKAEGKKLAKAASRGMAHDANVYSLAFSADGSRLVSHGADHTVRIWDARSGAAIAKAKVHRFCGSVAVSPDGRHVVVGGPSGAMLDAATGKALHKLSAKGSLESVAFSANGARVIAGGGDYGKYIHVFDVASGKQLASKGGEVFVDSVSAGPDGRIAATVHGEEAGYRAVVYDASLKEQSSVPLAKLVPAKAAAGFTIPRCQWTAAGLFAYGEGLARIDDAAVAIPIAGALLGLSPDGSLAIVRAKKRLALVSTRNGKVEKQLDFDADAGALSPSNRALAHAGGKSISVTTL